MWQVWQTGARPVVSVPERAIEPCLEEDHISHCGWSKPMWQVWQACGFCASFFEKTCRVWQELHPIPYRLYFFSSSGLMPTRWQPPHPLSPEMYAWGWRLLVGIAAMPTQALACLPPMYWSYCFLWHFWQVSAVGIAALAASAASLCASP